MSRVLLLLMTVASSACGAVAPKQTCSSGADCLEGYACDVDLTICLRACTTDADCITNQSCHLQGSGDGVCRAGIATGGDTDPGGDPGAGD